ncbi:MAG: glycosyltransferase [Candidatus Omnitrophica bacterium]|nr:glycosyltransferase [Candidatus Omnitrophota bacterium]
MEEKLLSQIEREAYLNVPTYDDILNLNLIIPPLYSPKSRGLNLGWYIFEADRVPAGWIPFLQQMDGVVTPTRFHFDQLRVAGYEKPVYILHEGVNPGFFGPGSTPLLPKDKFSFLLAAIAHPRKRWKTLVTAFLEEFSSDRVRLLLKLQPTRLATIPVIEQYITSERERTGSKAEIVLSFNPIPGSLAPLYASADCYVSVAPEGWGLPQMEAIACGAPAILLDWGGSTEWFTNEMGWKVPAAGMEKPSEMDGFTGYEDPKIEWAVPDLSILKEKMRYAFQNQKEAKEKGAAGSQIVMGKYHWKTVTDEFLKILDWQSVSVFATKAPTLSVAMITKNVAGLEVERNNLFKSNLNILSKLAEEIVVLDSKSTDETVKIAQSFNAKVIQYQDCRQDCGYCDFTTKEDVCPKNERGNKQCFSKFRRASFKMCTRDWILRIDTDEVIREEDIPHFKMILSKAYQEFYKYFAFGFPTVNFFGKVGYYRAGYDGDFSWFPDFHTRLYRNIPECNEWFAPAHESACVITDKGWVNIIHHPQTLLLPEPVVFHYGYLKPDCQERNDRYAALGAQQHNLLTKNHYSIGTLRWEGQIPNLASKLKIIIVPADTKIVGDVKNDQRRSVRED